MRSSYGYREGETILRDTLSKFPLIFAITSVALALIITGIWAVTNSTRTTQRNPPQKDTPVIDKVDHGAFETFSFTRTLPDGTEILCLWGLDSSGNGGGLTCDWNNRKPVSKKPS